MTWPLTSLSGLATEAAAPHPIVVASFTLRIDNMHCGSCVRRVLQTLNELPETHAEEVRVGSARVTTQARPEQIQDALTAAGYPARVESDMPLRQPTSGA